MQNIIDLNTNHLIIKDKPDSQKVSNVDIPLTSANEPTITSPVFTETIRTFTHSGGTEAQTTHTITIGAAIPEGNPITHKTLNFVYDLTKYTEYQAQLKTGVGGWRIVRFLPPNLNRWYQGDYISTSTFTIPTIGTPYNYTNEWAVSFGTFDEMFFGTFDMTYWLQCLKTSVLGSYGGLARPIIKSSSSSTPYSAIWYNRGQNLEDPWVSIADHPSLIVYGENSTAVNMSLLNAYGGMCVLVRDSTASTTIPNPNQYTLSVQPGTSIQVNNQPQAGGRAGYRRRHAFDGGIFRVGFFGIG
jgi:hypothetical protein